MNERRPNIETRGDQYVDVTETFLNATESEFKEEMVKLSEIPLSIQIPMSDLGSNFWQNRLKQFQLGFNARAIRKVTIIGTTGEKETFGAQFPDAEWKISG